MGTMKANWGRWPGLVRPVRQQNQSMAPNPWCIVVVGDSHSVEPGTGHLFEREKNTLDRTAWVVIRPRSTGSSRQSVMMESAASTPYATGSTTLRPSAVEAWERTNQSENPVHT